MAVGVSAYRYSRPLPPAPDQSVIDRFWRGVQVGAPDECWPWRTRRRCAFVWTRSGVRRQVLVHRFAWLVTHGWDSIPPNRIVAHRCDQGAIGCCNPAHLECVTQQKNTKDAVDRGLNTYGGRFRETRRAAGLAIRTHYRGEECTFAKLTQQQVDDLRDAYRRGARQVDLASRYDIAQSHVSRIVRAESWKVSA